MQRRSAVLLVLTLTLGMALAREVPAQQGLTTPELVRDLRWRNIGPANMMGRIASIDALGTDHRVVLVGSASGGVFLSDNAGITWDPIFDSADGAGSIGAAVLFQGDPDIIWVGTGEAANRNSSGWGDGVWRTTDGGATWQHVGLQDTGHIAEIATHPRDPEIAYVASPGHLWGYSGDRGLYKTTDGGASWDKLTNGLPDDGKTGCTEIIMDPDDPEILYAGFYHRIRQPASMVSGGEQGGLFKSTDAGRSWRKLTAGLPEVTGMIDIAIHRADPSIVVAAVEAEDDIPFQEGEDGEAARRANPGGGIYISRDAGESWEWSLKTVVRPFYHGQVDIDPLDADRIYSVGREFKVSKDGGETWINRWWGGGGDDHDLWIAPRDGSIRYMATDQGAYLTLDDGATVLGFENMAIGQYYNVGVDMRDPYWVVGGLQDNAIWIGPSNSREVRGILNMHNSWLAEGDGFASWVDPTDWRTVYAVNHVGFALRLNIETREPTFITPTPETTTNFTEHAEIDYPETPIDYTIDPGEHWFRYGRPERPLLPPQFRFNWNAPFLISPSNPQTLYFAGNHVFKSVDRGDTWRIISPDLTTNDPELRNPSGEGGLTRSVTGGENHFTIFTLAESPLNPELVWAGTDDGNVQITRNGGTSWTNVRDNFSDLPDDIWVGKVEASRFAECRAYLGFDNHRLDDTRAYLYRTDDCGESWRDISGNLPDDGGSYVIVEDPVNPELLFVGTEFGAWVTVDGGGGWARLANNLPKVAVRDLVIHAREGDLVAGTHGRSIWILDNLPPLRQSSAETLRQDSWLFEPELATRWVRINLGRKQQDFLFVGENPPFGALLDFWLSDSQQQATLWIEEIFGDRRAEIRTDPRPGLNRARWDLSFPPSRSELQGFAAHLESVIGRLSLRVARADLLRRLEELNGELGQIDMQGERVARALNRVRSALVGEFATYAAGRELFGPRLGPTQAAAGTYRVVLEVNGQRQDRELMVREDPLREAAKREDS